MPGILIIDDDDSVRDYLSRVVARLGHACVAVGSCAEGLDAMARPDVDVIVADIYLPDSPPLEEWVDRLKAAAGERPLILITGEPSPTLTAKAEGGEILAVLSKPFELAFIKNLITRATESPPPPA